MFFVLKYSGYLQQQKYSGAVFPSVSHYSHQSQSPSAWDALSCIVCYCSRCCVSLLLIIKTMKLFDYHIQTNVQRNGNFTASLSVPQFWRPKDYTGVIWLYFSAECLLVFLIFFNGFKFGFIIWRLQVWVISMKIF